MKSIVVKEHGGPDVVSVEERPEPSPSGNQVTVAVEKAGVNFADIEKRRGAYPAGRDVHCPSPPYVPGLEAAGRVVETGEDADVAVGEDVFTLLTPGCYQEYTTVPADQVVPIPEGLDYRTTAGMVAQFLTAHNALFEWGELTAGETVLVHAGAGGVGTAALQLADRVPGTVYTTASTERKRDLTRELGADRAIDYTEQSVTAVAAEELDDGFDLVLDGVGGTTFKRSLKALAPGGRLVTYGLASGDVPTVSAPRLLFENRSVVGYHLEHAYRHLPERVASARETVLDLFERGEVELVTDREFPLCEAGNAHRHIENRESVGKVLLDVSP